MQSNQQAAGSRSRLRVGILGAGTIAGVHAGNLDQIPEAQLVGVADVDRGRAEGLAHPRGAAVRGSLDELLERCRPDAVLVCLPPFATAGVIRRIAERGLHVYAEKPVGLDLAAAREDLAAVRRTGVVAASGYMWRASPIVERARELFAGRQIGLVQGTVITAAPPPPWWRDKALSGGMLVELATHIIDLVSLFGGEARSVTCIGAPLLEGLGSQTSEVSESSEVSRGGFEDVAAATVQFASSTVGSLAVTCGTTGGRWSVDVVAHNLHVNLNFFPERLQGNRDWAPLDYEPEPVYVTEDPRGFGNPAGLAADEERERTPVRPHGFSGSPSWYLSLRRFVRAAQAGDPTGVAASFEEGVQTLALTLALEQSLQAGGAPVQVPGIS